MLYMCCLGTRLAFDKQCVLSAVFQCVAKTLTIIILTHLKLLLHSVQRLVTEPENEDQV